MTDYSHFNPTEEYGSWGIMYLWQRPFARRRFREIIKQVVPLEYRGSIQIVAKWGFRHKMIRLLLKRWGHKYPWLLCQCGWIYSCKRNRQAWLEPGWSLRETAKP